MKITPEDLSEWERLCGEATEGPWVQDGGSVLVSGKPKKGNWNYYNFQAAQDEFMMEGDAAFISASREALPRLIERVRELEAIVSAWAQNPSHTPPSRNTGT